MARFARVIEHADPRKSQPIALIEHAAWSWWLLMAVAVVVGSFLRWYQLPSQMLVDDEWHAVRMLISADAAGIASHFGLADYSIPLTLYYRWLYDRAVLSEWSMHLPLLVAGIGLLLAAPWLLRRTMSLPTRALWTAQLAISPSLIYFSRTARPYALVALFGFSAIVAFRHWQAGGRRRHAWAPVYVIATFVAGWAHLLSLVFTLWPFVHYGFRALFGTPYNQQRGRSRHRVRELFVLGIATALSLALVLASPLINDWAAMSAKAGADSATFESFYRALLMQLGTAHAWVCMVLVAFFSYGIARIWRRDRDLVVLVLGAMVVGGTVICAARPAWIQHAPVLVRYAAPILPFLLLFVAEGFTGLIARLRSPSAAALAASIGVGGLFVFGPLPGWYYAPNQFMDHAIFQFDYDPQHNPYATLLELGPVSTFYTDLARRPPGSVTLIETPARAQSNFMPDPWLQEIHRQNVKYALAAPVCGVGEWDEFPYDASGVRFRRVGKLADILDGATWGADYLLMRLHPWTVPPGKAFPWPVAWPDMDACVAKVQARLGAPVFRDDQIAVFKLAK